MKYFLLLLLFICFHIHIIAQEKNPVIKISGFVGYASYSFSELENINNEVINQLPFDTKLIDNFPAQPLWGGTILYSIATWYAIGVNYEFHSTGSRVGAKDYSGMYSFDQILKTHQLGLDNEMKIVSLKKGFLFFDLSGGINLSKWKTISLLKIDNYESDESEKLTYTAIKPFIYPALKICYPINSKLSGYLKAGYLVDLGGKYHLVSNKELKTNLKIPWNGIRGSIGIQFSGRKNRESSNH